MFSLIISSIFDGYNFLYLTNSFDLTILIKSDINKRKQRVLGRGVTKEYFNLMNKKQMNQNTKSLLSDFTIHNNSSILNLRLNIIRLLNNI